MAELANSLGRDVQGHGFSDPIHYRRGHVGGHAWRLIDDVLRRKLAAIRVATMFIWGSHDPYLSAEHALPSIDAIASASLHELPGGHGPWLVNRECTSELIRGHLTRGGEPAVRPPEFSVRR